MAWYIYTGSVPVPVALSDGRVVVVKPRSKVEAEPQAVRRYASLMRLTSPPAPGAVAAAPAASAEPARPETLLGSPLSASVQELGSVRDSADVPAVVPVTAPKLADLGRRPRRATPDSALTDTSADTDGDAQNKIE
ncbi:hypothetical protein UFOVP1382_168 [uncultured Caudovirales phage]|uniref:Uncharacterized protein n=1 Tax=uncultured Caudovirales phage TaxID=2100421 RepID=A0A6J5S5A2_9CAUD|nr:hypothetical protein UFOVP1382_168 [uncultured Caudovirales phage]